MKKWRRYVARLLPILVISLVVGGSAYSWNARTIGQNQMPMPLGFGMSVVLSGSMEPTLSVNDLVFVRPSESYEPGDVIVYQSGNSLIIHRLLENDGTTAVTQGDANNAPDEPFPVYYIKGKLAGVIPKVGAVIQILQSLPGTLAVLALAVYLMIRSHRKDESEAAAETDQIRQEIEKLKAEMLSAQQTQEDAQPEAVEQTQEDAQPEAAEQTQEDAQPGAAEQTEQ